MKKAIQEFLVRLGYSPNRRSFRGHGGFVRGLDSASGPKSVHGNWPLWPPGASRGLQGASRGLSWYPVFVAYLYFYQKTTFYFETFVLRRRWATTTTTDDDGRLCQYSYYSFIHAYVYIYIYIHIYIYIYIMSHAI